MSDTFYQSPDCGKTAVCSKCEGLKTWNHYFHNDTSLCNNCYYNVGIYKKSPKEYAMRLQKEHEQKTVAIQLKKEQANRELAESTIEYDKLG